MALERRVDHLRDIFLITLLRGWYYTMKYRRQHRKAEVGWDIKFKYFDDKGKEIPFDELPAHAPILSEEVQEMNLPPIINGMVYTKPATVMLDGFFRYIQHRLPDDEPTPVKIDLEKSMSPPRAAREYYPGTNECLYVYLSDKSGRFTKGAWIDGHKVTKQFQ